MKRSAPMKRTPFRPKGLPPPRPAKQMDDYTPRARPVAVAVGIARLNVPIRPQPKAEPLQHAGYMALVRSLPCARCGWFRKGFIQFCHADEGKGTGIKSDCRLGWPGCGPHDGLPGCHYLIGTQRILPKEERRAFEAAAGASTRAEIQRRGLWPERLPQWRD